MVENVNPPGREAIVGDVNIQGEPRRVKGDSSSNGNYTQSVLNYSYVVEKLNSTTLSKLSTEEVCLATLALSQNEQVGGPTISWNPVRRRGIFKAHFGKLTLPDEHPASLLINLRVQFFILHVSCYQQEPVG